MRLIVLLSIAIGLGCQSKSSSDQRPERTEPAFIYTNTLAFDGCEEFVRLDQGNTATVDVRYKPTQATLPVLQKAFVDIPMTTSSSERRVTIRFVETGNQVELQCGWGSRPQVGEIEILSITKR